LAGDPGRPVRGRQEPVDHVQVQPGPVSGDDDVVLGGDHAPAPDDWSDPTRRRASPRATRSLGVATNTVSSPAMVPTTSGNPAASRARATGWAPAGGVFTTTREAATCTETAKPRRARSSRISRWPGGEKGAVVSSGAT